MITPLHNATLGLLTLQPTAIATDGLFYITGGGGTILYAQLASLALTPLGSVLFPGVVYGLPTTASTISETYSVAVKVAVQSTLAQATSVGLDTTTRMSLAVSLVNVPVLIEANLVIPGSIIREPSIASSYGGILDVKTAVNLVADAANTYFNLYDASNVLAPILRIPLSAILNSTLVTGELLSGLTLTADLYEGSFLPHQAAIVAVLLPSAIIVGSEVLDLRIRNLKASAEISYYSHSDGTVYLYGANSRIINILKQDKHFVELARAKALPSVYAGITIKLVNPIELDSKNSYIISSHRRSVDFTSKHIRTL